MAIYQYKTGDLFPLETKSRVWTGTKSAWEALSNEDKPKNCLVCFTDDWAEDWTPVTVTPVASMTYGDRVKCFRKGNEIMVTCDSLNVSQALSAYSSLAYGFPAPSSTFYANQTVNITALVSWDDSQSLEFVGLFINKDGNLMLRNKTTTVGGLFGFTLRYYCE